jgi:hypothetical protein
MAPAIPAWGIGILSPQHKCGRTISGRTNSHVYGSLGVGVVVTVRRPNSLVFEKGMGPFIPTALRS